MADGKVTTLIENVVYQSGLVAEHGFSALVEWNGTLILFDFGQSAQFLHNAVLLDVDPGQIDVAVVSHGHYDHTGGMFEFLSMNPRAQVWIREAAFDPKASATKRSIGIPGPERLDTSRFHFSKGLTEIAAGAFLLPPSPLVHPEDFHGDGLMVWRDGTWIPDDFLDEQSLVLVGNQSITLISACSHRGISNIVQAATDAFGLPIDLVLGGFHLKNETSDLVETVISLLNRHPIRRIGISHCTGVENLGRLQSGLKAEVFYNYTGRITAL